MGAVYNPAIVGGISICLRTKFKSEVFDQIYRSVRAVPSVYSGSAYETEGGSRSERHC